MNDHFSNVKTHVTPIELCCAVKHTFLFKSQPYLVKKVTQFRQYVHRNYTKFYLRQSQTSPALEAVHIMVDYSTSIRI